jgi:hypothetical protein
VAAAAREARRIRERDRIIAGERAVRKALIFYEGLGGLAAGVCTKLRGALAASVQLVLSLGPGVVGRWAA